MQSSPGPRTRSCSMSPSSAVAPLVTPAHAVPAASGKLPRRPSFSSVSTFPAPKRRASQPSHSALRPRGRESGRERNGETWRGRLPLRGALAPSVALSTTAFPPLWRHHRHIKKQTAPSPSVPWPVSACTLRNFSLAVCHFVEERLVSMQGP